MGPDSSKDKLIKIISDYSGLSVQSITQSKFSFKRMKVFKNGYKIFISRNLL